MTTYYADNYEEITGRKVGDDTYDAPKVPKTEVDPEVYYADDYEALTGRKRDGSVRDAAKVITVAEERPAPKKSARAQTK